MLGEEVVAVDNLVVDGFTVLDHWDDLGVDETAVRFEVQAGVTLEHFLVQLRVDVHGVIQDQRLAGFVVTFRLDALYLGQQVAEETAEFLEIVDHEKRLSVARPSSR